MKQNIFIRRLHRFCGIAVLAWGCIGLTVTDALAAGPGWRPLYDSVMLWINFFILVFVLVKYGRQPFMNYLKGQQEEVADELTRLQKQKNQMDAQIQKTRQAIEESSQRFKTLKERIIKDGERRKKQIIEDAKMQSQNIIEIEKQKADNQIIAAKNQFMAELVDAAVAAAMNRMPAVIRNEDHQRLTEQFMNGLAAMGKKTA